jgi:hypothetical protein
VYSLGVIWYQLLSEDFSREPRGNWRRALQAKGVPETHLMLLERCLDEPSERPDNGAGLVADIDRILKNLDEAERAAREKDEESRRAAEVEEEKTKSAALLRNQLLWDMRNRFLRSQYLAERTPELEELDRQSHFVWWKWIWVPLFFAAITGGLSWLSNVPGVYGGAGIAGLAGLGGGLLVVACFVCWGMMNALCSVRADVGWWVGYGVGFLFAYAGSAAALVLGLELYRVPAPLLGVTVVCGGALVLGILFFAALLQKEKEQAESLLFKALLLVSQLLLAIGLGVMGIGAAFLTMWTPASLACPAASLLSLAWGSLYVFMQGDLVSLFRRAAVVSGVSVITGGGLLALGGAYPEIANWSGVPLGIAALSFVVVYLAQYLVQLPASSLHAKYGPLPAIPLTEGEVSDDFKPWS